MFDDEFEEQPLESSDIPEESSSNSKLYAPDLDSYPETEKQEAIQRYKLVKHIRKGLNGSGWTQSNIDPLLKDYFSQNHILKKPNWRTIVRWHKKLYEQGDTPTSLVEKHHNKGNRNKKLDVNHEIFFEAAVTRYLKAERPSVANAYRFYRDQCLLSARDNQHEMRPMSQRAFYNRIDQLNSYEVAVKRLGKYKADIIYGYKGETIKPERIMQRVEIDHTPLDIILVDDETKQPIGRPYLTLLKDIYSGCLVGYHLTFKAPSYASVAKAICHTILPKPQNDDSTDPRWPCCGKIEVLVVDNGAEFWSTSLEQMCYELGINVQYNPVRKPWLKPFIERSFRTINDLLLDEIPGKTFRSIDARGDYNAVASSSITLSSFVFAFEKWMAEVYNCSPDSRGLKVPSVLWQEGMEKLPPATLTKAETLELPKLAGLKDERAIQSSGITYQYLRYDSEALADYRKQYLTSNHSRNATIKIDVDDLSRIFVYLPEQERYLTVPCVDQNYTRNLSLDQHLINKSLIKAHNKLLGKSETDLAAARQEIREVLAENDKKSTSSTKTTSNKKIAQYKGYSNQSLQYKPDTGENVETDPATVSYLETVWESYDQK